MKRTPSAISNARLSVRALPWGTGDGRVYGVLMAGDDVYVWACDHRHVEPRAASRCVVREVRRWALERGASR